MKEILIQKKNNNTKFYIKRILKVEDLKALKASIVVNHFNLINQKNKKLKIINSNKVYRLVIN